MNSIDFCYWLQGYFEMSGGTDLSDEQVIILKNHLNMVFKHEIDPLRESQTTATPTELNAVHHHSPLHAPLNDELMRC